ncbi:MAG: tol-pal system protein YbgF [Gammaproteobacteria bacterium]
MGIFLSPLSIAADKQTPVVESNPSNVEQRLNKLEQLLQSQGLLNMLQQLESLQSEINQLRGEIEVQNHTLEQLKKRQRDIYTDLDRRIQDTGSGNTTAATFSNRENPPLEVMPPVGEDSPTSEQDSGPPLKIERVKKQAVELEQSEEIAALKDPPPVTTTLKKTYDADPAKIQSEYQQAFKLLKKSQYDHAIKAFSEFLETYPDSQFSDNAQYWLGETYYVTRRYEEAITEYNKLISQFPESQKLTHSLLKIGYSHHELGQMGEAKRILKNLKENYPGTTAARLAEDRLRRINAAQ